MSKAPEAPDNPTPKKMNINEASEAEIAGIPFVGAARAKLIRHYIDTHGKLTDITQLDQVTGIGGKIASLVADWCEV